jgi:sucrose-6-phosphate hydrolase SacC (GH32 family)
LLFLICNDAGEYVLFSIDSCKNGKTDFAENFADKIHILPCRVSEKEVDIRAINERSSIEIFVNEAAYVMTEQ